jgi:UDP-galactopyranose mutase
MSLKDQDLVCFSHLRWNFVFQRPQHLLTRFAKKMRVFYVEEPAFIDGPDFCQITQSEENIWVVVPHIQRNLSKEDYISRHKKILSDFFEEKEVKKLYFLVLQSSLSFY